MRLVFWSLILWGALASLQGLLTSSTALIVVRFGVGVVEAAVLPAMVILLANWFTSKERGRANTYLILGNPITVMWLSAVSGYLIELTSWRGMFIIEGIPAIAWAFVFRYIMRDKPRDAKWLDAREAEAVEAAIAAEQAKIKPAGGYLKALTSRNVLLLSLQYFLWSLGIYGFVFWLPSIVSAGSKSGIGLTGLISAIPYGFAAILMLVNSRASDRAGNRANFVWPWLALGADRVLRLLPDRRRPLLVVVPAAGHRRRLHVRPVRPVLRLHPGVPAPADRGGVHRADQLLRRARRLRRRLPDRLAERQHRLHRRLVPADGRPAWVSPRRSCRWSPGSTAPASPPPRSVSDAASPESSSPPARTAA